MRIAWGGIAFLLVCGFVTALTTAASAVDIARMEQVLQAAAVDNKFMGTVLVAQGDTILLDKGYGYANLEWNIPNTPQTRLRIASLAKQFTAAAILLLEERGKLKLDDPVKAYIPDAPAAWDKITLFSLLTQTSGIPDFTDAPDFGVTMKLHKTPEELTATVLDKPLDFPPGEKFSYSNTNYVLLGRAIEKVSGTSFAKFMQDNIFTPLGMKDSGYDSMAVIPRHASGYAKRDGVIVNASYIDQSVQYGAGGLYSTTHDLLTWEKALLGGKLISPASLKKMMTPFRDARGPGAPYKAGYGMGVYVGTTMDGRKEISHTGSGPGTISMMAAYPDDKLFVILLSNIQTTPFGDIVSKLTDIAFGRPVILPSERKQVAVDSKILARYTGRYQLRPGFVIEIAREGDVLVVHAASNPAFTLLPENDTNFFAKDPDLQVEFKVTQGHVTSLVWRVNGDIMDAPQIP